MTPDADASDEVLLRAHVEGDPTAFTTLVRRHRDKLWAVSLRTTGNPEDAADALQDALISAFRRADSFRGEAKVTTWLHRIVVNACLDKGRRSAARPTSPLPEDDDRQALPDRTGFQSAHEVSDRRADVLAALRMLPAEQRAAVVLVDMEGYSVDEAAQILQCQPGTVKSRCSRGRARLAPLLVTYRRNLPGPAGVESSSRGDADDPPSRRILDSGSSS